MQSICCLKCQTKKIPYSLSTSHLQTVTGRDVSTLDLCMYFMVYIDDIIIRGDEEGITKLKHHFFSSTFRPRTLDSRYFLGMRLLNPDQAFLEILNKTRMIDFRLIDTLWIRMLSFY